MFIKNNLSWINIENACYCLELNRSSYYKWIENEEVHTVKMTTRTRLVQVIKLEHASTKKRYGATKIAIKL